MTDNERVDKLWKLVLGDGEQGLIQKVDELRSDMYANKATGSKGLVADMAEVKGLLRSGVAILRFISWAIGSGVLVYVVHIIAMAITGNPTS